MKRKGFTLIELLVVITIIGLLVGLVAPRVINYLRRGQREATRAQISIFKTVLTSFFADQGRFPDTLEELIKRPSYAKKWSKGGYLEAEKVPKDPWGNDYIYIYPGVHLDYDIISYGADGKEGGEDWNGDICSWKLHEE